MLRSNFIRQRRLSKRRIPCGLWVSTPVILYAISGDDNTSSLENNHGVVLAWFRHRWVSFTVEQRSQLRSVRGQSKLMLGKSIGLATEIGVLFSRQFLYLPPSEGFCFVKIPNQAVRSFRYKSAVLYRFATANSSKDPWNILIETRVFTLLIRRTIPKFCTVNCRFRTILLPMHWVCISYPRHIVPVVVEYGTNGSVILQFVPVYCLQFSSHFFCYRTSRYCVEKFYREELCNISEFLLAALPLVSGFGWRVEKRLGWSIVPLP